MPSPARFRQNSIQLNAAGSQDSEGPNEVWGVGGGVWALADDFMGELEGPHILNSGADAQAVDPARVTDQPGGVIALVTGNADGTMANDGSQLVVAACPVQLDAAAKPIVVEARIKIDTAVTDVSVFFGLTDATGLEEPFSNSADTITSTATDACGFLFDTDATTDNWWMVAVDSDTDDTGNASLGIPPVADAWQHLKMVIEGDGSSIAFYVDGSYVDSLSGGGVGDDVPLYATITACATTTTSKTVYADWIRISGERA